MTVTPAEITLIVRECGERTAEACATLLSAYFQGQAVHRVSGRPFETTLRRSLELGLREGRPWTLCIDADALALPRMVSFAQSASNLPQHALGMQALVLDKLLRVSRPAGNHLYRTALLAEALACLPAEGALRPETAMIDAMSRIGHPFHQSLDIVGLHDFEQCPRDIYAKAFLHGHKHRYLADLYTPLWQTLAGQDDDYRIALAALEEARNGPEVPVVGRDHTTALADAAVARLGIADKGDFGTASPDSVQHMLEADRKLSGEAGVLRARLQERIDADLAAQEQARQRKAASRRPAFLVLLKQALLLSLRGRR